MWINIGIQGEEREEAMLLRNGRATVGCAASGIPSSAGFLLGFQTQASAFGGGGYCPPHLPLRGSVVQDKA